MKKKINKCLGSSLENLLEEEGILEEVYAEALKTSIALQIKHAMEEQNITLKSSRT